MRKEIESKIVEAIKERMGDNTEVTMTEVIKNNDMKLTGVVIREDGAKVSPTIYIDGFLSEITDGDMTVEEAVESILDTYEEHKAPDGIEEFLSRLNKEELLNNVEYQLVNREKNRERLEQIPYEEYLDLALIYRYRVSDVEDGAAYLTVTRDLAKKLDITEEELAEAARKNEESKEYKVVTMASVIAELMGVSEEMLAQGGPQMYVASNESKLNGASAMLNVKWFRELADKVEDDLYILPSSIHELIMVPASQMETEDLREMVASVNATEVSENEILSNTVYRYNREEDEIKVA